MVEVELPEEEAKDSFERVAGVIMGTLAVVLAVLSVQDDNAAFDAQVAATQAANRWAHYQAKSIKEHSYSLQKELLALVPVTDEAKRAELAARYAGEVMRYEKEKDEIKKEAEAHEKEVEEYSNTSERYQRGTIQLEIALVLGSIALLTRWKNVWRITVLLGLTGLGTGVWAFVKSF